MTTEYKTFGDRPDVTVRVTERDDIIDRKNEVAINWSCCGELSIEDAMAFYNAFGRALGFALVNQARLNTELV